MNEPILLGCLLERGPHPELGPKEDGLSLAFRSSSSIRHIAFTKASTSSEPVSEPSQSFLHTAQNGVYQSPGAMENEIETVPDRPQLLPVQFGAHPDPSDDHALQSVILPSICHPHTPCALHATPPGPRLRRGKRRQVLVGVGDEVDRKASPPGCLPSFLDRRGTRSSHARHTEQSSDLFLRFVEFCFVPHLNVCVEKLLIPVLRGGRYWGSSSKYVRRWAQSADRSLVDGWRVRATTGVRCPCGRRA